MKRSVTRRALLVGAGGAAAAVTAGRALGQAPTTIDAGFLDGTLPLDDPLDAAWQDAKPLRVAVFPQQITVPTLAQAGIDSIDVRALYSAEELGFLVQWRDELENTEDSLARFHDAVAVQLPAALAKDPPPFTMGGPGQPVHILQWRASWQADIDRGGAYEERVAAIHPRIVRDVPPEAVLPPEVAELWSPGLALANPVSVVQPRSPVDELVAEGFGSATSLAQSRARGRGERRDGSLLVALGVPRERSPAGERLSAGSVWPVGFAVWLGSMDNRGGRKHWSNWVSVSLLEQP